MVDIYDVRDALGESMLHDVALGSNEFIELAKAFANLEGSIVKVETQQISQKEAEDKAEAARINASMEAYKAETERLKCQTEQLRAELELQKMKQSEAETKLAERKAELDEKIAKHENRRGWGTFILSAVGVVTSTAIGVIALKDGTVGSKMLQSWRLKGM